MKSSIRFGSKTIEFDLSFSERKTLGITVTPDFDVLVKAPTNAPIETIHEKLRGKAPWILKQQSFFLTFHPKTPPRKFVAGETHLYFGKQYRLQIEKGKLESVNLKGRFIVVNTFDIFRAEFLVKQWYLRNAKVKFPQIAKPLIERFKRHKVEPTAIVLREMAMRWGSCTPKGKIILNPELIKSPRNCIEYVIIHELCHLIHHNHTQKFIDLQTKEMPGWEKWKNRLEMNLV